MFKHLAAPLFLVLAFPTLAEPHIAFVRNPKLGILSVEVAVTPNPPGQGQSGLLIIRSEAPKGYSQRIELGSIDRAEIEIGDFNFDGIEDIRIRGVSVGLRNESSNFYIYNSSRNAFVADRLLASLSNPTFDSKLMQVTSVNLGSGTSEYREVFRLHKHKWVRVSVRNRS